MVDEMAGKILRVGLAPGGFTRVCLLRVAGPNTMRLGGDEQEPVAAREGRQLLATSPAWMIDRTPEVRSSVGGLFFAFPSPNKYCKRESISASGDLLHSHTLL